MGGSYIEPRLLPQGSDREVPISFTELVSTHNQLIESDEKKYENIEKKKKKKKRYREKSRGSLPMSISSSSSTSPTVDPPLVDRTELDALLQ